MIQKLERRQIWANRPQEWEGERCRLITAQLHLPQRWVATAKYRGC
jgi:hypothetical protein